jgi:aconitate hydratase
MNTYKKRTTTRARFPVEGEQFRLGHGDVVIAAITSCTNTSNPSVLIAAGLLARKARAQGPDSQAVGEDLARAGQPGGRRLSRPSRPAAKDLDKLGFNLVGYRLHHLHRQFRAAAEPISKAINDNDIVAAAVLSGNRNFEGRVNARRARQLSRLAAAGRRLCAQAGTVTRHGKSRSAPARTASRST